MAPHPSRLVQQALTDPDPRDRLRAITDLRSELEALEIDAVSAAVGAGASWSAVADALGVSKQSAHKRFARVIGERRPAGAPRWTDAAEPQIVVTARARHAVRAARAAARALGHAEVDTSHLLLGLLADPECPAATALEAIGVRFDAAQRAIAEARGRRRRGRAGTLPISTEARGALEQSLREALRLGHTQLGGEHLLLGIVRDESNSATHVLGELDISPTDLERCLGKVLMEASFEAR